MKTKEYTFHDGDTLKEDIVNEISSYLINNNNDFFIKTKDWKVNFVGFIELYIKDKLYRFYSFPKHFNIKKEKEDIKVVLDSLYMLSSKQGISNEDSVEISSKIINLKMIVDYYKKYGLFFKQEKEYIKGNPKNINFQKTIKKVIPKFNNNQFIYDEYYNNKKKIYHNFITDTMVYIINNKIKDYSFFIDDIKIDYKYNKNLFNEENEEYIIKILKDELNKTFKDNEKDLIKNMLEFLTKSNKTLSNQNFLCTSSYHIVWEEIVALMLGHEFEKKPFIISDDKRRKIEVDHFNKEDKKIYDSKYYKQEVDDKANLDYKQLFYHYHIVPEYEKAYEKNKLNLDNYGKWENALIKPCNENQTSTFLIERKNYDNVSIKEYFIDCRTAVYFSVYRGENPYNTLIRKVKKTI